MGLDVSLITEEFNKGMEIVQNGAKRLQKVQEGTKRHERDQKSAKENSDFINLRLRIDKKLYEFLKVNADFEDRSVANYCLHELKKLFIDKT